MSMLFDVEHLQKLSYERSKYWANFLDKVAEKETFQEIDINELCDVNDDENESLDELASMEDEKCNDVELDQEDLRNITSTTRLSLLLNNKTVELPHSIVNDKQNQLIETFNQTLPIINEHNRQLKEYGLDKVLISFDKKKIEEKVGSWLNRHNSLYGGDNTILFDDAKKVDSEKDVQLMSNVTNMADKYSRNKKSFTPKMSTDDTDDSLQSGETARYIRSCRAGSTKKYASTTSMIKKYRMVKSTREVLREKYAFDIDYNDYHPKTIGHCRKLSNNIPRRYDMTPLTSRGQRRKVLRKRTSSNSCSTEDSSSDSDYYEDYRRSRRKNVGRCCTRYHSPLEYDNHSPLITRSSIKKPKSSAMKMKSAQRNRMYYCSHSRTNSLLVSSASHSFCSLREKCVRNNRQSNLYVDNRQCKRESECHCCYEAKLCDEFKHVTDTSTEEWYVENCGSPKEIDENSTAKIISKSANRKLSMVTEIGKEDSKTKIEINHKSFEDKESAENEQQMIMGKNMIKKQCKRETMKSTPLIKTLKMKKDSSTDKTINKKRKTEDVKILPKIIEHENNTLETVDLVTDDSNSAIPKTAAVKNKNRMTDKTEKHFFTATQSICNSTALSAKSQAYNRQIIDKLVHKEDKLETEQNEPRTLLKKATRKSDRKKKNAASLIADDGQHKQEVAASTAVSSTTIRSPEMDFELTSKQFEIEEFEQNEKIVRDDDSERGLVTSTTNIEQLFSRTLHEEIGSSKHDKTTLKSQKDILIYTPNMAAANSSITGDYFIVSKEYLANFIGEKQAKNFMKYYIGSKRFKRNSTVYYRPPQNTSIVENNDISSSDSVDELDNIGQCGDLYVKLNSIVDD